jgi:hypothetical protein
MWSVRKNKPFRGSLDYDGEQVGYLRFSNEENQSVVDTLNRAGHVPASRARIKTSAIGTGGGVRVRSGKLKVGQ